MAAKCKKFEANIFNKNKCGVCFKSKNEHSAAALESSKAARKISKCGYLFIAPDLSARRWQRRFFILFDDGELTYSVDEMLDTVPQGVMDMNECEDVFDAEEQSGHEFSIAIVVPQKTYYVKGTSKEEINRWHDVLVMYPRSMKTKHKRTLPPTPTSPKKSAEISPPSYSQSTPTHKPLTLSRSNPATSTGPPRPLLSSTRFANSFDHAGVSPSQSAPASALQPALAEIRETQPVLTREPIRDPGYNSSLKQQSPPEPRPGYLNTEQRYSSSSPPDSSDHSPSNSLKRTKSDHGLNDIPGAAGGAMQPTPVSYRGVRSLKHKHDDRYHDGLRKSNSCHDLPSASSSQDDLTDKFLSKDWYKATSPNGLGSTSLSPKNTQGVHKTKLGRAKSFSSPSTSHYESDKPRTLFHTLMDEQKNPKPQSSYYSKIASVPKSKLADQLRAAERRKTQPEIRYFEANRTADSQPVRRRSSFQDDPKKDTPRDPSPPDTVFKYGRRGLESLASEYANTGSSPASPEKKIGVEKDSPKKISEPAPQVPEQVDGETKDSDDGGCLKKGWLHKQGGSDKEWTKYWFVLHGDALKYFKDSRAEEQNTLDGRIDLSYCYEVTDVDATKNYGFKVRTRNGSYILSAMTSGIRNNWVQALVKYVKTPGSNMSTPPQSENQSPKTTRSGARLRRTLPHIGSKSVSENDSPSDFNRRNTVDVVKLEQPEIKDPLKSPTDPIVPRRRSDRLSERLAERRLRRSAGSIDSVSDRPPRRPRTLRQSQVDETSSCGSQSSIAEVASEEVELRHPTKKDNTPSPKRSPKHDSHYHRRERRSDSSRYRARHHSSGSEYGSNDSLSLLKDPNPETRLLAKSPIEKKLDKLRARSSRVRSPPPPSADEQTPDLSVRSASSSDERAVVELLETEVESLQNQLERAQKELLSVHKDNVSLKTQIRLQKEKEKEEEDELDDDDDDVRLMEKCNMLEIRIAELELENTSQINEKANMDTKLDRMKKDNDHLMNTIQGIKQENGELRKQLRLSGSETSDLQKELESLKNDLLRLKDAQEGKNSEMAETRQKLEEYRTDSRKKKRQVREKEDQISELKENFDKKGAEFDRLQKRYENVVAQLEEKTSTLELNRVDSRTLKEREMQLAKVQAELERKAKECSDMMNKYNAVSTEVQDVRAALEESERTHHRHTDTLQDRDELVESLNDELSKMRRECQNMERQSNEMSKELQDTKTTLRDSLQILDSQKSRVDEKDEQIHDLKKQLEKRNYDYEDACIKCEDLTAELDHAKAQLEDNSEELEIEKAESDEKDAQIDDLRELVDKKSGDCDMLLNKYNELLAEYDDIKATLESGQEMSLLDQLEEKEDEVQKLREDLEDRTEDCEDLSDRIDDLEHHLVDAKAALVEAENRASRPQTKEKKVDTVDVATEMDFDVPSMTVLPVKMDQIVQTFFVEHKQSRSLDSDYSSDVNLIKSLRSKVKENQDKCDELDFMNIKLNEKIKALMQQYDCEIKSYGARIDDLVVKLRLEQKKKRQKQSLALTIRGDAVVYSKDVESELSMVEKKIAQAEQELLQQESTAEELENQIGSVEQKLTTRDDEDEGMSSQEEGSCSTVSSPGVSDSEQERNSNFDPVTLFQDGQDFDNNNSSQFFSRIQGLHDKVAQSNAKLKEVLGMLDSNEEFEEEEVTPASQEQTHAVEQRLSQCEQRLQNITSRLQSTEDSRQSSRAGTPPLRQQTLRGVISTHESTLSVLQECRSRLSESLHGLESYDNADVINECLEQIRATVTDMIQHAQSEELAIRDNRTKLLHALDTPAGEDVADHLDVPRESLSRPRTPEVLNLMSSAEKLDMYAENVALKSLIGGEASYFNQHWRDQFIQERDQYFEELRLATERIGELEDTIDYLTDTLDQEKSHSEKLKRQHSLDSYASLFSESMIHHGIAVSKLQSIEEQRENERERLIEEVTELNEKITHLEDALHRSRNDNKSYMSSRNDNKTQSVPELANVLSENITLEAQKRALMREYQDSMLAIREQQIKEFKLFNDRIQSMESKITELSDPNLSRANSADSPLIQAAISRSQSEVGAKLESLLPASLFQEDWGVYSQATSLVSKAMAQAELTVRINRLRESLVNCSSKQEQLRVLDQEMDLAQTKLRSREKLMTEIVDKYKDKKICDLAQLISSNSLLPLSPAQTQFENGSIDDLWSRIESHEASSVNKSNHNRVLSKLLGMVKELAGFYRTLDMVGDTAELQLKLEASVQQEIDVLTEELLLKCEETTSAEQAGLITEEFMHNMVYNLADILAQRAMIEAQFQYIADLQQKYKDERDAEIPSGFSLSDDLDPALPDPKVYFV